MEENNLRGSMSDCNNLLDITSFKNSSYRSRRNINDELLSLLRWLNEDFVPVAMHEISSCSKKKLQTMRLYMTLVEERIRNLNKFAKLCDAKGPNCKEKDRKFWNEFLASETFDELMASRNVNNRKDDSLPSINTPSISESSSSSFTPFMEQFVEEVEQFVESPVTDCLDSAIALLDGLNRCGTRNENQSSSDPLEILSFGRECCVISKKLGNFKFGFAISYNKNIEKLIYAPSKKFNVLNIDGLGMPTIQFKSAFAYKCLICCCEAPLNVSNRCIHEHVHGNRHSSKKSQGDITTKLIAYHDAWLNQEEYYQAHQTYFYPHTYDAVVCYLCVKAVPFNSIVQHIHTELHKTEVLKLVGLERSPLLNLQEHVYLTAADIQQKQNASTSKNSREVSISDSNEVVYKSQKVKSKGKKNAPKKHKIIPSIIDANSSNIRLRLEYRLWPHLQVMTIIKDKVKCSSCDVTFENNFDEVISHVHSSEHLSKVNITQNNEFYCELCALTIRDNGEWFRHLSSSNHKRRCALLKDERKASLNEYECVTCQLIIYGDSLSLKRHQDLTRRVPKAEVVLSRNVVELFNSTQYLENYAKQLVDEANKMLLNSEPMIRCVQALETALRTVYPSCKVYPFGSRVSGLGNENSDLDVFVDIGDMYLGDDNQDRHSQEKYVYCATKIFRKLKNEFNNINPIPTARTPIVQVYYIPSDIDCDLSFKHGLSVENTKFLRLCIRLQPITQSLILVLKQWMKYCKLDEYITTYALAMMVIFYLQIQNLLFPITKLKSLSSASILFVNGWSIMDFTDVAEEVQNYITPYIGNLKSILVEFFNYYKSFDFASDIICPLLGYPIKKQLFINKPGENLPEELSEYVDKCLVPDAERLKAQTHLCVQDPFDLSHNLTKACTIVGVNKLKAYCDLSGVHLNKSS